MPSESLTKRGFLTPSSVLFSIIWDNIVFSKKVLTRFYSKAVFKNDPGASLVAQWLRVCLPMQGTRVRALVWEDPTCRGVTKPVSHNC